MIERQAVLREFQGSRMLIISAPCSRYERDYCLLTKKNINNQLFEEQVCLRSSNEDSSGRAESFRL